MQGSYLMDKWDERERNQADYDIQFLGDHIHEMENNHCKLCGKTVEQILRK